MCSLSPTASRTSMLRSARGTQRQKACRASLTLLLLTVTLHRHRQVDVDLHILADVVIHIKRVAMLSKEKLPRFAPCQRDNCQSNQERQQTTLAGSLHVYRLCLCGATVDEHAGAPRREILPHSPWERHRIAGSGGAGVVSKARFPAPGRGPLTFGSLSSWSSIPFSPLASMIAAIQSREECRMQGEVQQGAGRGRRADSSDDRR